MTTNAKYAQEIQKLGMGAEVVLYKIDLTALGGPTYYLTPMAEDQTALTSVTFGTQEYTSFPIVAEGFEWVSGQAPPQPTISVSNIDHAFTSDVLNYEHLIGGKVTRIRTFDRFLAGGAEPDGNAHMPLDIFRIDRKTVHNESIISWELASWIDQHGRKLPGRLVIRDYCSLIYRDGRSGTFDYSKATCPYTGADKFTKLNVSTLNVNEDVCSHTLAACKLRFGNASLPFGGFPGVAKFRV